MGTVTPPRQSYILWFTQRVGSTLLAQALEDTGVAGRPREWFNAVSAAEAMRKLQAATVWELRDELWRQATSPNGVLGIKYGMEPKLHAGLSELLASSVSEGTNRNRRGWESFFPNCTHFLLTRRDKIGLAVSWWRAIKSDEWHRPARVEPTAVGRLPGPRPPPREEGYDYEAIAHLMAEAEERERAISEQLDKWGVKPQVVVYEDLVASFEASVRRVLEMLKLEGGTNLAIPKPAFEPLADAVSGAWRKRFMDEQRQKRAGR